MIDSINRVVKEIKDHKLKLMEKEKPIDRSEILLNAITAVKLPLFKSSKQSFYQNANRQENLDAITCVAKTIAKSFNQPLYSPFLKEIRRSRDENLHSDYIAAVIRSYPPIIKEFELKGELLNVQREVRLDYIDSSLVDTNLGQRRIDIIIETNLEILIIENKVDSTERKDQTEDYYRVIKSNTTKEVKGLMLSPLGLTPQCEIYKKITYYHLFLVLNQIPNRTPILEYYLAELFDIFIKPFNRSHE